MDPFWLTHQNGFSTVQLGIRSVLESDRAKMTDSTTTTTNMTQVPPCPPQQLTATATCGGSVYCGHPWCDDTWRKNYNTTGEKHIERIKKMKEYFEKHHVDPTAPQPLTATATCGGTLTYCGHPWCENKTI